MAPVVDAYVEQYLAMFPGRATGAGDHRFDRQLEDLSPERLAAWADLNRGVAQQVEALLQDPALSAEDRIDGEILLRQARGEVFELTVRERPTRDPLFWTGILSQATVFLLVRDDRPLADRLDRAAARVEQLPRLVDQAMAALRGGAERVPPEPTAMAARQVRASAGFYRSGFARAADVLPAEDPATAELRIHLEEVGAGAAAALDPLADLLETLAEGATGDPRLGDLYAENFRLGTGIETPVDQVLEEAERTLMVRRAATADYCRGLWTTHIAPGAEGGPPRDDAEVVRSCFARIGADGATDVDAFVEEYRELTRRAIAFVEERGIMTLPEGLRVLVDRSPAFLAGQAVGGVYPAGPWSPDAPTLLFVPTPPQDAPEAMRRAFFRDFNHHFNVMITPHETVPGHAAQLAVAARQPRKVRALFGDGVYVEGWGTFSERLMLDLGWGDELARVAHLKKELENLARAIVDIRVHTRGADRDDVLRFVREEALQDEQFAANMWVRALTTSPQITTYSVGYRQILALYDEARGRDDFEVRSFVDGMTSLGAVPVRHYRARILGGDGAPSPEP
ncbi:MAG: DUF885 domain-containing protein [Acidobacteriota bacterium]